MLGFNSLTKLEYSLSNIYLILVQISLNFQLFIASKNNILHKPNHYSSNDQAPVQIIIRPKVVPAIAIIPTSDQQFTQKP